MRRKFGVVGWLGVQRHDNPRSATGKKSGVLSMDIGALALFSSRWRCVISLWCAAAFCDAL
jgi:predicted phage tail protein